MVAWDLATEEALDPLPVTAMVVREQLPAQEQLLVMEAPELHPVMAMEARVQHQQTARHQHRLLSLWLRPTRRLSAFCSFLSPSCSAWDLFWSSSRVEHGYNLFSFV